MSSPAQQASRVLVTGGAGFIGSHLTDALLADGYRVRVLDNLSTGARGHVHADAELIEGDVRDEAACRRAVKGVDTVFHLAAQVTIRESVRLAYEDADTNVMGTLQVLRAAGAAGVRRFILASSMAVYADAAPGTAIAETHPTEPVSPYGVSKLAAEQYMRLTAPDLGIEPVVLRLFNTFGDRQGYTPYVGVVTIFITRILRGEPCLIYGDGEQRRDFTHVSDVVAAFRLAARSPKAAGELFNVGTGIGTSVNDLAAMIRGKLGRGEFSFTEEQRTEVRHSVADIKKARRLLGYRPAATLPDRLDEIIAYLTYRRNPQS